MCLCVCVLLRNQFTDAVLTLLLILLLECFLQSSLGDEEVHVVASMLRDNVTIEELQFRRNYISDDGARAIAAVLADRSALKLIDLRENHVSMIGIKAIADALERSKRVRHVFVHPGGKIEAFGSSETIDGSESTTLAVSTVCIVDVRDNIPKDDVQKAKAAEQLKFMQKRRQSENEMKGGKKTRQSMSQSPSQKHRHKKRNAFPPVRPLSAGSTKSKESKRFGDQQIGKRSQMSPFLKK